DYGIDFPTPKVRLGMLREAIELMKRVWTQEKATYLGKYYRVRGAYCEPKTLQKTHPPLMVGGGGEELTLRIVARHADKSNFGGPVEAVSRKLRVLRRHCSAVGRDYDSIEKTCNLGVVIHPTWEEYLEDMRMRYQAEGSPGSFEGWLERAEAAYIAGTPEMCLEQIEAYVDLGMSLLVIRFGDIPGTDGLELFAREVIPKLRNR
ncbi:MAG: LLM class flavin-dependent oxidoreductase, partial [Candidatus Bathyarchaeia archaeon]